MTMKLFVVAFLGLMACACLVSVQAGLGSLLKHDDADKQKKKDEKAYHSHYQGGLGKQVAHTIVDGAVDRLGDMAEVKFDNPLMHAAIVGGGKKLKNRVHDKINDFGDEENQGGAVKQANDDHHHHHFRH